MKKYNNIANHMRFSVIFVNILFPVMIVSILLTGHGVDMIIGSIVFALIIVMTNIVFIYLQDLWYFTYYDEKQIVQKWFKKRKKIDFDKIQYMYFIDNLVILSEKQYNVPTQNINITTKRRIKRMVKNEVCIVVNVFDKIFPKILLAKSTNAIKIDLDVKETVNRELFELDKKPDLN